MDATWYDISKPSTSRMFFFFWGEYRDRNVWNKTHFSCLQMTFLPKSLDRKHGGWQLCQRIPFSYDQKMACRLEEFYNLNVSRRMGVFFAEAFRIEELCDPTFPTVSRFVESKICCDRHR